MVVVPLSKAGDAPGREPNPSGADSTPWIRYAAASTLAAGGALLVTGNRRAGLVTALAGAVLTMIDQQEVVNAWWNALPIYLEEVQEMLGRAQSAVNDLSQQGEKLRRVLSK